METLCQFVPRARVIKGGQLGLGFEARRDIFCERTFDVGLGDRVVRHDRVFRCGCKGIEGVGVELAGWLQPAQALKRSESLSVIVTVAAVDHARRKASPVEQILRLSQ